jgi:hypothetical protein
MRFRFTIRDLFWLTALVAMGVGWWLDHRRLTEPYDPFVGRVGEPTDAGCLILHDIQANPPPTTPPPTISQP